MITIAIVWFCAWAGDTTSFCSARRLGRDFVLRHGPKVRITPRALRAGRGVLRPPRRQDDPDRALHRPGAGAGAVHRRQLGDALPGVRPLQRARHRALGGGLLAARLLRSRTASTGRPRSRARARSSSARVVAVIVAIVSSSRATCASPRTASRLRGADRASTPGAARRLLPQVRFAWRRLTPGGLGLEFTSLIAVLSVSLFVLIGYALIVTGDAGPTPGDAEAIDVVDSLRAAWLTDVAKVVTALGSRPVVLSRWRVIAGGGARACAAALAGARRCWSAAIADHPHRASRCSRRSIDRPAARRRAGRAPSGQSYPERPRGVLGLLRLARADGRGPGAAGAGRYGTALIDRRARAHGGGRAQPRLPRRALPERRQRRLGAGRGRVRGLRGDRDGRHSLRDLRQNQPPT